MVPLLVATAASVLAAPSGDAFSPFTIGKTLFTDVLDALDTRHEAIRSLGTDKAKWKARQGDLKTAFHQLFSPLPPANRSKPPPAIERGTVAGDGFVLHKLLIEVRPGHFAPCGLWLPSTAAPPSPSPFAERPTTANANGQIPAILLPSGHDGAAWRDGSTQIIAYNLIKRGIAVLGYDPIGQGERRMLPDLDGPGGSSANGTESFSPAFEHEYLQRQSALNGVNAASSWIWDMTVITDYLEAHPRVDASRLGVAGCSGGGCQTAYHGAMDERMVAASIACYTSTLAVDLAPASIGGGGGPAEGEQQWGPFVAGNSGVLLDKPDLLQIRSPRATQVLLTTEDQYFPLAGGRAAYNETVPAFAAYGAAGNITKTEAVNRHGYINGTRRALYAFFSKHFNAPFGDEEFQLEKYLDYGDMLTTSTGNVINAPELNNGKGSLTTHQAFVLPITKAKLAELAAKRKLPTFVEHVAGTAAQVVGITPAAAAAAAAAVPPTAPTRLPDGADGSQRYTLRGEGRCVVAVEVYMPNVTSAAASNERRPPLKTVLYVSRKGNSMNAPRPGELSGYEQERISMLRHKGFAVALVDVCGFGTIGDKAGDAFALFNLPSKDYRVKLSTPVDLAFNLNRSIVGVHAGDVVRAATAINSNMLQGLANFTTKIVATISTNDTAPAVLTAAVTAQAALGDVALVANAATWASVVLTDRYYMGGYYSFVWGALDHFDMPDMVAALPKGTAVLVAGPLDAKQIPLPQNETEELYSFASSVQPGLKVVGTADAAAVTTALFDWLPNV